MDFLHHHKDQTCGTNKSIHNLVNYVAKAEKVTKTCLFDNKRNSTVLFLLLLYLSLSL